MAESYAITTRADGTIITAAIWNGHHQQHADYQVHALTVDVAENAVSAVIAIATVDVNYQVSFEPNWNTTVWWTAKGIGSVTVAFGTPAPAGAKIDVKWRRDI